MSISSAQAQSNPTPKKTEKQHPSTPIVHSAASKRKMEVEVCIL